METSGQQWLKILVYYKYFMCRLFNNTVSTLDYMISNDRIINEELIGKDMDGSSCNVLLGTNPALNLTD